MTLVRITRPQNHKPAASSQQVNRIVSNRALTPPAQPQFYVNQSAIAAPRVPHPPLLSQPNVTQQKAQIQTSLIQKHPVAQATSTKKKKLHKNGNFGGQYRKALAKSRVKYSRLQPVLACSIMVFSLFFASAQPFGQFQNRLNAASINPTSANSKLSSRETLADSETLDFPEELTSSIAEEAAMDAGEATPSAASVFDADDIDTEATQVSKTSPKAEAAQTAVASLAVGNDNLHNNVHRRMSQIRFLSGMIAIHMPSIKDCGALAKDIVEISAEKGVDPFYVASVISVESRFGSNARSNAGAVGLMQLLPSTARDVYEDSTGKRGNPMLTHPRTNIRLGINYLQELEVRFAGNKYRALAAYNWGFGNVEKVISTRRKIPGAVNKYALTILERAVNWRKHFEKAEQSAASIATADMTDEKGKDA